jgi:hypothetical protein
LSNEELVEPSSYLEIKFVDELLTLIGRCAFAESF